MLSEEHIQTTQPNELAAGGSDPTSFEWKEAWYPIHYVENLDKSTLTKFTLLNQDLVIWCQNPADRTDGGVKGRVGLPQHLPRSAL